MPDPKHPEGTEPGPDGRDLESGTRSTAAVKVRLCRTNGVDVPDGKSSGRVVARWLGWFAALVVAAARCQAIEGGCTVPSALNQVSGANPFPSDRARPSPDSRLIDAGIKM